MDGGKYVVFRKELMEKINDNPTGLDIKPEE